VVPAQDYLQHFASDRRHMVSADGTWNSPPPVYPCIVAADGRTHTLPDYLDMEGGAPAGKAGRVMEEPEFLQEFCRSGPPRAMTSSNSDIHGAGVTC
jgi:protein N-terminal glutamine amidohydrolase